MARFPHSFRPAGLRASLLPWALAGLALLASAALQAQRLPLRSFSPADGLPAGAVRRIVRDAHGFLWFCSADGAARFDGQTFVRFGTEAGLPSPAIQDLLQTRDGCYWFATDKGLCRLNPALPPGAGDSGRIRILPLPGAAGPLRLLEDSAGILWCGTTTGLLRVDRRPEGDSLHPVELGLPRKLYDDPIVSELVEKPGGGLWIGSGSGLYVLEPDGRVLRFTEADGLPDHLIRALASETDGTLWVGTAQGIATFRLPAGASRLRPVARYSTRSGMANADVLALLRTSSGGMIAGTAGGLTLFEQGVLRNQGAGQGIKGPVFVLAENTNGDLWLGNDSGVQRWAQDGLTTYTPAEGLRGPRVDALFEDQTGTLVAGRAGKDGYWLHSLRGPRFEGFRLPLGTCTAGWGWNQVLLQDHLGAWWLAASQGLARFDRAPRAADLARSRHMRMYPVKEATGAGSLFTLFEDSRGDIWYSAASPATNGLGRWRRDLDRIEGFQDQAGLPRLFDSLATAFTEDRAGNVWIAFNGAGIARFRSGRFDFFSHAQGVPEGWIRSLMKDASGRIWLASSLGGAGIIEAPEQDLPRFRSLTTAQGLASNSVWSLVEDRWGRVYVGTGAGIDRFNPEQPRAQHLSEAEGLAPGVPRVATRDRQGALWFGMSGGLSRYLPTPPRPAVAPPIFMTGLRVAGVPKPLPESGTADWELPELAPSQNRLQVGFTSPEGLAGSALLYQYRLEGISEDWTPASSARGVDLANLASGQYHFQVRAVGAEGQASTPPAELRFTILAPVWRRGWFLVLATGSLLALAWQATRIRLRHLLEVERIRTRIAADLHDDIGASLSRIAILSEVVKQQTPDAAPESFRFLTEIADSSRELVDAMADIVWSIDPRRDDLQSLLARVGQFAAGVLQAKGIRWSMSLPADPARIKLTPEQRRGMFLILKEAINNAVKHSGCRAVNLLVEIDHRVLSAQVRDDGQGLPPEVPPGESSGIRRGRGLVNMQARALEMGGHLVITSDAGGTLIHIELPQRIRGGA